MWWFASNPSKRTAQVVLSIALTGITGTSLLAQNKLSPGPDMTAQIAHQQALQNVIDDKAGYAAAIVSRWEDTAKAMGKWDANYAANLYTALFGLQPENLLAAGQASTYQDMMSVLATGHPTSSVLPQVLGDTGDDLVYTPVTPCRIVDTRNAGGILAANTSRAFDMDGASFGTQGGYNGSCGIPFGVARAVAMTITSTQSDGAGYLTAWSVATSQPFSSVLNFSAGQNIANTTIVPTDPGAGNDFWVAAGGADTHLVIDVVGYFAAPVATALDCTQVSTAYTAVGVNSWTALDASCPAGYTLTGGGFDTNEGTLGYPGVWVTSLPNGNSWRTWVDNQTNGDRHIASYAMCCRVPGR